MSAIDSIQVDVTLNCIGLACPMPIVKTKKAIESAQAGHVIEVQATDRGSLADLQGWASATGHQYLGTVEEGKLLRHYIRKASPAEEKMVSDYPHTITAEELAEKLANNEPIVVLDVREPAEFAFQHVAGALSMPLGVLAANMQELDPQKTITVICRSGNRSGMACRQLEEQGFQHVWNVIPGMLGWSGPVQPITSED